MKDKSDNTSPTDAELLEGYRSGGDPGTLGTLYARYLELCYGLALRYLGNRADAEDAVMQLFEELPRKLAGQEVREFRTWLYTVCRNHCLGLLRQSGRIQSAPLPLNLSDDGDFVGRLADADARERMSGRLTNCMKQLPEPQRRSIRLFFFEECSYADIAQATTWHVKSVKSYIQNGKRNLRLCLENTKQ